MPTQIRSTSIQQYPSVRVFTLGRFRVEVADAPLRFGRKAQRRPIDLLKLLIAYGGEAVNVEQLAADLWPDSEGYEALNALRTTLTRLRKLLGGRAILGEGRALTLNREVCWVDATALAQQLAELGLAGQESRHAGVHAALDEALSLYRGDFLPGECALPAVLSNRNRLRRAVLRHLGDLGRGYEQARRFDRAMEVYYRGLEIDAAAEDIARRLMQCSRHCGRCAEGIAVYRSCRDALKSRLGTEPSVVTRAVHDELMRESAHQAEAPAAPTLGARQSDISIAVGPFEDLSPQGERRHLAQAIRETVIVLLDAVPRLPVVAGAPGRTLPSGASAARYILRGSVMVSGARLRARVNLLDVRTARYIWSEQLDYALGDLVEAQDQIAIKVAEGLVAKLVPGQYPLILLAPDVQLWKTLALVTTYLSTQVRQDYQRARVLLDSVMESEQDEPAVAMLSSSFDVCTAWKRLTPDPVKSLRAGEQKLRRVSSRYGCYVAALPQLAFACALRGNFDEALLYGRRAVDKMPELVKSHAFLGLPFQYQGRHAEALDKMRDAFAVCPQPPHWLYKDRAVAQFCLRQYDEAARGLATALLDEYPRHRDADLLSARMMYVASLAACGRLEEARHEAAVTLAAHPAATASGWREWHFHPYRIDSPAQRVERLLVASGLPA